MNKEALFNPELSDRKKTILKAIVESHITDGEPVGSKLLTECGLLSCSSATIRNEMAELSELGYLEQPHTSAGRIPSEMGYRFYVDSLRQDYSMTAQEIQKIRSDLDRKQAELDDIITRAGKLAGHLTNYTGLAVKPKVARPPFIRFETLSLEPGAFLLMMISADDSVDTKYIRTTFPVTPAEIEVLSRSLNQFLVGVPAEQITLSLITNIERRMGAASRIVSPVVKCVYDAMTKSGDGELKLEGINRLLQYPEYADVGRFQGMLDVFENKRELLDLVSSHQEDDMSVIIGSENNIDILNMSSLVFKTVKHNGVPVGAIGVIGPKRMHYSKVITMLDSLTKGVNDALEDDNHLLDDKDN
jgi:heat-inducible transcriptional repressor